MSATNPSMLDALLAQVDPGAVIVETGQGRRVHRFGLLSCTGGTYHYSKSGTLTSDGCAAVQVDVSEDSVLVLDRAGAVTGDELSLRVVTGTDATLTLNWTGLASLPPSTVTTIDLRYIGGYWVVWRLIDMTVPT